MFLLLLIFILVLTHFPKTTLLRSHFDLLMYLLTQMQMLIH